MPIHKQLVASGFTLALLLIASNPEAEATAAATGKCESRLHWSICKTNWMCTALCCVAMRGYTGGYCSSSMETNQEAPAWLGFRSCICTKACHGGPPPKPWVQPPPTPEVHPPPMPTPWVEPPPMPTPWMKPPVQPPPPTPEVHPPPMPTPWAQPPPTPTPWVKPPSMPTPWVQPPLMPAPCFRPPLMPIPWVQPLPPQIPTPLVQPWPMPTPCVKPPAEKQQVNRAATAMVLNVN